MTKLIRFGKIIFDAEGWVDKIIPYGYYFYMNKKLKNLPIGISDFERIREKDYLYIDKTKHLYNLIVTGEYYFLSRPRRFGKSLIISTLYNIFRGKKELFKGLYIYDSDYEWEEYPVVLIDFNEILSRNSEILEKYIVKRLHSIADDYGVEINREEKSSKEVLLELTDKINEKYGKDIVFLIDEYDKPIIDHLGKGKEELKIADKNRELLKEFYGTFKSKGVGSITRFVFITGITKFSKVSIFSELNNLTDLTMEEDNSEILGIKEEEIDKYLTPYIEYFCNEKRMECNELREELRNYYNGYRFSSKDVKVYNPFSLFSALRSRNIKNYWFETGTPTFLINLIEEGNIYIPEYEDYEVSSSQFSVYELDRLSPLPLMFQSGYLTIKDYNAEDDLYVLSYPNKEVRVSFTESILTRLYLGDGESKHKKIRSKLNRGEVEEAIEIIKSVFSEIPYTLMKKKKLDEADFHILFYLIVSSSGVGIKSEILAAKGRIDALIETRDRYYIIEFKCNQSPDKAIQQIKEKKYYEPYKNRGKEIILIGINFSTEDRNISDYKVEKALSIER